MLRWHLGRHGRQAASHSLRICKQGLARLRGPCQSQAGVLAAHESQAKLACSCGSPARPAATHHDGIVQDAKEDEREARGERHRCQLPRRRLVLAARLGGGHGGSGSGWPAPQVGRRAGARIKAALVRRAGGRCWARASPDVRELAEHALVQDRVLDLLPAGRRSRVPSSAAGCCPSCLPLMATCLHAVPHGARQALRRGDAALQPHQPRMQGRQSDVPPC